MKFAPYSFSKLSCFETCPLEFKFKYIDKFPQEKFDDTALKRGSALHSILEKHHKEPVENKTIREFLESDVGQPVKYQLEEGKTIREFAFGLDEKLQPTTYKKGIFRGKIDLIYGEGNVLKLIDYKSGRAKSQQEQNYDQLTLYAIYFFRKYEFLDEVEVSYVYIEHNHKNSLVLKREYMMNYIKMLSDKIHKVEKEKDFNPRKSFHCKYCAYAERCLNTNKPTM